MAGKIPSTAKMALAMEDGSSAVTDPSDWSIEALQVRHVFVLCIPPMQYLYRNFIQLSSFDIKFYHPFLVFFCRIWTDF